jgi:hypothetical protein
MEAKTINLGDIFICNSDLERSWNHNPEPGSKVVNHKMTKGAEYRIDAISGYNQNFRLSGSGWYWWSKYELLENFTPVKAFFIDGVSHIAEISTPSYYNNTNGSLYKVATQRCWGPYLFDVVKRLERGGKKDPLRQEIEKSIVVMQLWLQELEDEG